MAQGRHRRYAARLQAWGVNDEEFQEANKKALQRVFSLLYGGPSMTGYVQKARQYHTFLNEEINKIKVNRPSKSSSETSILGGLDISGGGWSGVKVGGSRAR